MRFRPPKGTYEPFSIYCSCHRPRTRRQSHGHVALGVSGNRRSTLLECKGRNQRRQPDLHQRRFTVSLGRFGRVGAGHQGRENDEGQLLEIVEFQIIARAGVGPRSTNERTVLRKSREWQARDRQQRTNADVQGRQERPVPLDQVDPSGPTSLPGTARHV